MVGSNTVLEVNGKRVRARVYPWGVAEGIACDDMFLKLSISPVELYRSDDGLTLETSAFKLFMMANLRY